MFLFECLCLEEGSSSDSDWDSESCSGNNAGDAGLQNKMNEPPIVSIIKTTQIRTNDLLRTLG
jgi:hypothetical protein